VPLLVRDREVTNAYAVEVVQAAVRIRGMVETLACTTLSVTSELDAVTPTEDGGSTGRDARVGEGSEQTRELARG
jgi:hypothetical protein